MRLRAVSLMLFTLLVGIAVLPAAACDLEQKAASNRTVTAFLTQRASAAASTPLPSAAAARASRLAKDALAYPNKSELPLA